MKKTLNANALDDHDWDQINNRITAINNLFLAVDEQTEVTEENDNTINRFFRKLLKIS